MFEIGKILKIGNMLEIGKMLKIEKMLKIGNMLEIGNILKIGNMLEIGNSLFLICVTETISRTDEGQPRTKYFFNKCGSNIYFFLPCRGLVHHHHRILKRKYVG